MSNLDTGKECLALETRTLFMIGNGFDLAHGLRTSYMDFFYCVQTLALSLLPEPISLSHSHFTYRERTQIQRHFASKGIIKILNLDNPSKKNIWCTYFERVLNDKQRIETWIDLEKEIQFLIQKMELDVKNQIFVKTDPIQWFKSTMNCSGSFNNYPKDFSTSAKQIKCKVSEVNSIYRENLALSISIFHESLALFLYEELLRYTFCFELYLAFIMPDLFSSNRTLPSCPLNALFRNISEKDFLLSFNYTTTAQDRYNNALPAQYIHGRLRKYSDLSQHINDPDFQLSTPLIIGFHSSSVADADPTPFLYFEKFFQRILRNTGDDFYKWVNTITKDHLLKTIVYGHSLDITDQDFIRFIFEKSHFIKVYYHQANVLPALITNLVSIFGREEVNRIHSQGKLSFISTDTLIPREKPEANYALT